MAENVGQTPEIVTLLNSPKFREASKLLHKKGFETKLLYGNILAYFENHTFTQLGRVITFRQGLNNRVVAGMGFTIEGHSKREEVVLESIGTENGEFSITGRRNVTNPKNYFWREKIP